MREQVEVREMPHDTYALRFADTRIVGLFFVEVVYFILCVSYAGPYFILHRMFRCGCRCLQMIGDSLAQCRWIAEINTVAFLVGAIVFGSDYPKSKATLRVTTVACWRRPWFLLRLKEEELRYATVSSTGGRKMGMECCGFQYVRGSELIDFIVIIYRWRELRSGSNSSI